MTSIQELFEMLQTTITDTECDVIDDEEYNDLPPRIESVGELDSTDEIESITILPWLHGHTESERTESYTYC